MLVTQIEVYRNGEHVANFPVSQLVWNPYDCVRNPQTASVPWPPQTASVPWPTQVAISEQIRQGRDNGRVLDYTWKYQERA